MPPIQLVVVRRLARIMGNAVYNLPRMVTSVRPTILYSPTIPRPTMVIVLRLVMVIVIHMRMISCPPIWGYICLHIFIIPIFPRPISLHRHIITPPPISIRRGVFSGKFLFPPLSLPLFPSVGPSFSLHLFRSIGS